MEYQYTNTQTVGLFNSNLKTPQRSRDQFPEIMNWANKKNLPSPSNNDKHCWEENQRIWKNLSRTHQFFRQPVPARQIR